jgi:hypothetical protein
MLDRAVARHVPRRRSGIPLPGAPFRNKGRVIPGSGIQTFQTAGEFKLEAIGDPNRDVDYGYMLLGLKKARLRLRFKLLLRL